MAEHELKTTPYYFDMVRSGAKNFELRKNDRGFEGGDILHLLEYEPYTGRYTGHRISRGVTYILDHAPELGLKEGYCIMALVELEEPTNATT